MADESPAREPGAGTLHGEPGKPAVTPEAVHHSLAAVHAHLEHLEHLLGPEVRAGRAVEHRLAPTWQRAHEGEHRLPVAAAMVVAIVLELVLPSSLEFHPAPLLPSLEGALLIGLVAANPRRIDRSSNVLRSASILLIATISVANAWSAAELINGLIQGTEGSNAAALLGDGAAIYLTNIIVFGLWYWELDRGGPAARALGRRPVPDLLFPQMDKPELAAPGWRTTFFDYLWFAYTNATAFSPTDVMPMSRWAKQLMMLQSAISLATAALVIARAVNIFK